MFTFNQNAESGQVSTGNIRLDTSTSARVRDWKNAFLAWGRHPVLGHGVTGYNFVDSQYPRVLTETGIVGFIAFVYLLFSIFRLAFDNARNLKAPYYKDLSIGFLAGYIGLLVRALGANTFIIVRIMEPFCFFAGIIAVLPMLERQQAASETVKEVSRTKLAPAS